ncbi:MAG: PRTRC system protein B [Bacteroidota bacterium]
MNNITNLFSEVYKPFKALVFYKSSDEQPNYYAEAYDMSDSGVPLNAHPLSIEEASSLADNLNSSEGLQSGFLRPSGLLPENILYINPDKNGYAIWYSNPQKAKLFFIESLQIPNGMAFIPALIWKATKTTLSVYALKENIKPSAKTKLFHAPFFNFYKEGNVCMGTVDVEMTNQTSLEEFINGWQEYFFNSYFSHLLNNHNPVKGDIIQLWQDQVNTNKKFPSAVLTAAKKILKDLIQ